MKTFPILGLAFAIVSNAWAANGPGSLAPGLAADGDHHAAAIEFRRLSLANDRPAERGAYDWAAAHEYWRAGEFTQADKMLDAAEDQAPDLGTPALLLRAETALAAKNPQEGAFYLENVLDSQAGADAKTFAARELAAVRIGKNDAPGAREALARAPEPQKAGAEAIDRYAAGHDKSPRLGGWLGLVPGAGYAYAGECANALRSLILNSLFIYGMVSTADDEQWGGFAVITFFEITWYSGSIYGGVDASHRYNERRLSQATAGIQAGMRFEPDYGQLPTLSLRFTF